MWCLSRGPLFALFTVQVVLLSGCAAWRQAAPPLQQTTAEELARSLGTRERVIQTMKGLLQARIKGPGIPIPQGVEVAMYYRRPDMLRFQGFTRLGGELFEFRSANDHFQLRIPAEGQIYTGRVSELDQMGKIGRPIRLTVLAMQYVAGGMPVSNSERLQLFEEGDRYRLEVFASQKPGMAEEVSPLRRVWFERHTMQVVQEEWIGDDGAVEATLWLEDFRPVTVPVIQTVSPTGEVRPESVEPILKPFKITVEDGRGRGALRLIFREMVLNPQLRPRDFGLLSAKEKMWPRVGVDKVGVDKSGERRDEAAGG